jgi:hypothetical protein
MAMQILVSNSYSELDAIEDAWNRLCKYELLFVPGFSELRNQLRADQSKFRLLAAVENSEVIAIACFIYNDAKKEYYIGSKKLFRLPIRSVSLFGSCIVGQATERIIRDFFHVIIKEGGFDLIDVGFTFVDVPLYRAVKALDNARVWEVARKKKSWWLVRLPNSFDEYVASLRAKTRKHITRDYRRFQRESPQFHVMQRPEEVDVFLRDAEEISRLTYQWKLNYGVRNDEHTRRHLISLARQGVLRCYISYIGGRPCAFGWGDLWYGKFYFRQTGYDPAYSKLSPGTALMMDIIRDMIENTDCEVFHFQWGGDEGYKSRLGTESHICTSLQAAQIGNPYSLLVAFLDHMLNLAKNSVGFFVERGPLKSRLRGPLRRRGVGTF